VPADDDSERHAADLDGDGESVTPANTCTEPEPDTTAGTGDRAQTAELAPTAGPSGREVVVPSRVYKTVTVMSTLLAMAGVVGGFVALDAATNRASAAPEEVDASLALLGLGLIVGGAVAYAFGTRFRAAGLGGDGDERSEADKTDAG